MIMQKLNSMRVKMPMEYSFFSEGIKFLVLICILFIILVVVMIKTDYQRYKILKIKEMKLRNTFETKQQYLNDLNIYRKGLNINLDAVDKLFTTKHQIPLLLEDISKMGVMNGLIFESFTPLQEFEQDLFTQLPIAVVITGRYQQIVEFLRDIAQMPALVTWHDFTLTKTTTNNSNELLRMSITVNIYRTRNK